MWKIIKAETFDDLSINLVIEQNNKKEMLEAIPTRYGYLIKRFNQKTGLMSELLQLQIEKPASPERIVTNCIEYLDNKYPENTGIFLIDIGDMVICDHCNDDYTNLMDTGGFLFDGKAICPKCAPDYLKDIKKFNELNHIQAYCPKHLSFQQFVLTIRKIGA